MKTLVTPEQMTIICNIQALSEKIHPNGYNWIKESKRLYKLSCSELRIIQNDLLIKYNKLFTI
jgi:hypothetical protein